MNIKFTTKVFGAVAAALLLSTSEMLLNVEKLLLLI